MTAIVPDLIAHLPQGELPHNHMKLRMNLASNPWRGRCQESELRISSRMAIGSQIQAWRLSRGVSSEYLAAEAGISLQALDEIETESLDPSTGTLERLANALKIPVAWLFAHPNAFEQLFQSSDET